MANITARLVETDSHTGRMSDGSDATPWTTFQWLVRYAGVDYIMSSASGPTGKVVAPAVPTAAAISATLALHDVQAAVSATSIAAMTVVTA